MVREQAGGERVVGKNPPLPLGQVAADAIGAHPLVSGTNDLLGLGAQEHIDDVAGAEALAGAEDAGQEFPHGLGDVAERAGVEAHIAGPARRGPGLAEVGEQAPRAGSGWPAG